MKKRDARNINAASLDSGLPVKTIRYDGDIGLINAARDHSGDRDFSRYRFPQLTLAEHTRSLDFTIEDYRALLALYETDAR